MKQGRAWRGVLRLVVVVTAACVAVADAPRAGAEEQARPDLDEVLDALRTLVAHPAWAVVPSDLEALNNEPNLEIEAARTFLAALDDFESTVFGAVLLFGEASQASQYLDDALAKARQQAEDAVRSGFEPGALTVGAGAGSNNALSGLHMTMRMAESQYIDVQAFHHGRVVVMLYVSGVPQLDRVAQDEALDHAAAFLRDPARARTRPRPTPRAFEGQANWMRVHLDAPGGVPVRSARCRVRLVKGQGAWTSLHCMLAEGAGEVPISRKLPTQIFVFDVKGADGDPLPVRPAGPLAVEDGQAEMVVRLQPGPTITGRVLSPSGEAVEGIRVEATFVPKDTAWNLAEEPPAPEPSAAWSNVLPDFYAVATSASDGTFELVGLVEGGHRLRIVRDGQPASPEQRVVEAGATNVELRVRPTPVFRLTVKDHQGAPVPMASVNVSGDGLRLHAFADEAGVAALTGLDPASRYWLGVSGPRSTENFLLSTYREDWSPQDMTVRLQAGWLLRGVVHDEQGQPVKAWIYDREGGGQQTGADGTFEFERPRQPIELAAGPLGHHAAALEDVVWQAFAPTNERIVLTVRASWLTVRALDARGRPVPRAHLRISRIDKSGRVEATEIERLEMGLWRGVHPGQSFFLEVFRAESDAGHPRNLAPKRRGVLGPNDRDVTMRLVAGGVVKGRVLSPQGAPLPDITVAALPSGDPPLAPRHSFEERAHAWVRTEADGTFTLEGLGSGSYDLRVGVPDAMLPSKPVKVRAGDKDVRVVLRAP